MWREKAASGACSVRECQSRVQFQLRVQNDAAYNSASCRVFLLSWQYYLIFHGPRDSFSMSVYLHVRICFTGTILV